ncbi:hypothetical protein OG762_38015 [Streptomyces sp. NBC_01136]|uniref:alpha/beta fold hydrolase n=1 Tax=unclassified Streptomyces TaxID=2593676 RepID=UPI00324CBE0C|nr:hypothetical protein OG762_38015 [Streptomyces sp. NBC_01136]
MIAFDNRGVGAPQGKTPGSVTAMARDAIAFIRALGYHQVDLLGRAAMIIAALILI